MARVVLLVAVLVSSLGCAFGHHLPYHQAVPRFSAGVPDALALAVEDERPSVLMGGRPDFVGFSRGGWGKAFDVITTSGQPLARDFAASIRAGLEAAGCKVTPVNVANGTRPEQVARILSRVGTDRLLVVKLIAWESDTLVRTALDYELRARAFGPSGEPIGTAAVISGRDVLGGDPIVPFNVAEAEVPRAYRAKLEQILNHPGIARALTDPIARRPAPPAPPPPASEPVVTPAPDS